MQYVLRLLSGTRFGQEKKGKMQEMTAKAAVDIALQSPNEYLTFEFQGGEPLLNFETIKYIVEYS